jgi:muramoyltetrapeptide carboxypeptidase
MIRPIHGMIRREALMEVAIVACSSQVPLIELDAGAAQLKEAGFGVTIYPQCRTRHFTYAGTDDERAAALFDAASDPRFQIIWCARGGYGATRLLPLVQRLTEQRGIPPRKLLIGYSDVTALHAFLHRHWGWPTLHGLMPASNDFLPTAPEVAATLELVRGRRPPLAWENAPLTFLTPPPRNSIEAPVVGGNLTLLAAMCGTPYFPPLRDTILFLEDVGEAWYRLDRMVTQLSQASAFDGVRAILLGNFKGCRDDVTRGRPRPGDAEEIDLRDPIPEDQAMAEIFGSLGQRLGIPVAKGLPIGHGPDHWPLPLNTPYRLDRHGRLEMLEWEWFGCRT